MEQNTQNRLKSYGALAGAIAGGVAVILTALADYKMGIDPYARPGAFTDRDGDELRQQLSKLTQAVAIVQAEHAAFTETLAKQDLYIAEVRDYIEEHERWGKDLARTNAEWKGKIEAEHHEFQRKFDAMLGRHRGYMEIR